MVRESLIISSELKSLEGNSKARDDLLEDRLGIPLDQIYRCRTGNVADRVVMAASLLQQYHLGSQIKYDTLAAIVFDEWNSLKSVTSRIERAISEHYRNPRLELERETGFMIPNIHILRADVGAYQGNLIDAKRVWPNFTAGHPDWLRSVQIPTVIDNDVALLLGIYWSDGCLNQSYGHNYLQLIGSSRDIEFYNTIVAPLVHKIHHIAPKITHKHHDSGFYGNSASYVKPVFVVGSVAISTWLRDDLGLTENRTFLKSPKCDFDEKGKKYFMAGIIASHASINKRNEMYIHDSDLSFIRTIYYFLQDLGLSPRVNERKQSYQLAISPREVYLLAEIGVPFLHPDHKFSRPKLQSFKGSVRRNQIVDIIKSYSVSGQGGPTAREVSDNLGLNLHVTFRYLALLRGENRVESLKGRYALKT